MYDYIIIGTGVVGSAIARELSRYDVKVLALEKSSDVANGQTLANSAIIHSGHDPKPGTLKAKLCVRGNELYDMYEQELGVPLLKTGAYVVAHDLDGEKMLDDLVERSHQNHVPVSYVSLEELQTNEPNLSHSITKAISLPTTKVTYPWEVALACMDNAIENGVELKLNQEVTSINKINKEYQVVTKSGDIFKTRGIINSAGVYSDTIAAMIEPSPLFEVTPRKGEYFVLGKGAKGFVNSVIYPLPTSAGKGILLTPQVHDELLVGPTSEFVDQKDDVTTTQFGLTKIINQAKRLSEDIPYGENIRTFSGVRATITQYDYFIEESKFHSNIYHLAGIDSPGLTSAPAIAEYVVQLILEKETLQLNENYVPGRVKPVNYHRLPREEQIEKFKENSLYGKLICKCEKVTEADVINAVHGNVPATSIKAVKKRVRAGAGLCQGGYCEGEVLRILARELNLKKTDINYYEKDTPILMEETKVG